MVQIITNSNGGGGVGLYKYKGSVDYYEDLPTSGMKIGDVYNVVNAFTKDGEDYPAGTNVAWTGTDWDPLGGSIDLSDYQKKLVEGDGIDLDQDTNEISVESAIIDGAEKGATAIQPGDNVSELVNDAGYLVSSDLKQSDWGQADSSAIDYIKNKPTIGNGTLTVSKNGVQINTFSANQTSNSCVDISVPTKTSDIENDSGYIDKTVSNLDNYTLSSNLCAVATSGKYCDLTGLPTIPTDNCQLANGCGYTTCTGTLVQNDLAPYALCDDIPTNNCQLANGCGYITGINCTDVTSALGYTPYNSTNPNGYTTCTGTLVASDLTPYAKTCDISCVGKTNQYCDLTGLPTIPGVIDALNSSCTNQALSAKQGCVLNSCVSAINGKIPSAATTSNQLADKAFVNSSINALAAFYITKNAAGDQFDTYAELIGTTTYYSGGVVRVPTTNDYAIVKSDENHNGETTRYSYQTSQWEYQYTVNESPLTQCQLDALNSGITSAKVSTYDGYATSKQDVSNMVCTLSGADNSHYPTAKAVADALSCAGAGDMLKSVYDPNNKNADAFDYCNFTNTPTIPTDNCQLSNGCGYITSSYHDSTKQDKLTAGENISISSNVISADNYYRVFESDVTVTTTDEYGVAPYSTSYYYTNFDISSSAGIKWVEGAIYTFIVDTTMVVASAYRNVRVKIGTGAYIPVMSTTAALAGHSYFAKTQFRQFQYSTKYVGTGALHLLTDSNTTYSAMSVAEFKANTCTCARSTTSKCLNAILNCYKADNFCTVATSGKYCDLTGTPTLCAVATSGKYCDLTGQPTIGTATLTIQKNGTNVNTFSANATSNVTANITVPTDTGDLTNGAGFITGITSGDVTSALGYTPYNSTNPAGYTTCTGTLTASNISDTAYGSGWNGVTTVAPSKNAVYDKIETMCVVPSGGTEGQVLTKTSSGCAWADASGGDGGYYADILVVGGGGGGGANYGGGGGGGAVKECERFLIKNLANTITIGSGGNGGVYQGTYVGCDGGMSCFGNNILSGGGGGGACYGGVGRNGCCGGGGGGGGGGNNTGLLGGCGDNGNDGGPGYSVSYTYYGGGGGGAAGTGGLWGDIAGVTYGGAGYKRGFDGVDKWYGVGGGGGSYSGASIFRNGGGKGGIGTNTGTTCACYGAGGGGGGSKNGGAGYQGVVIVRYPSDGSYGFTCATGGTKTSATIDGIAYCIHTFTSNGTFTIVS